MTDSAKTFRVHMLDMGKKMYGDCLLLELGTKRLLIDGGHPKDGSANARIGDQLDELLEGARPHHIDLLIVTHCHADHIGCLPELVSENIISVATALVADTDLGYPEVETDSVVLSASANVALDALLEEVPPLVDDETLRILMDAGFINREAYEDFLASLRAGGAKVHSYGRNGLGPAKATDLLAGVFPGFEISVLGPSVAVLKSCRDVIQEYASAKKNDLALLQSQDASGDSVSLYRAAAASGAQLDALLDGEVDSAGPARNNQSIVLVVEGNGHRVLLCGDMQLAKPEITGLDDEMRELVKRIAALAPYSFAKVPHHGSYNGFSADVLDALGDTVNLGISTGISKTPHPSPAVRKLLRERQEDLAWARTDRNGQVTVTLGKHVTYTISKGKLNDSRGNPAYDAIAEAPSKREALSAIETSPPSSKSAGDSNEIVKVVARVPHKRTRVTLTIDIDPSEQAVSSAPLQPRTPPPALLSGTAPATPVDRSRRLGAGRDLPRLLFVLPPADRLERRIGNQEAQQVRRLIDLAKQPSLDAQGDTETFEEIRSMVATRAKQEGAAGIVLVGGYDLVPTEYLDLLDPGFRATVPRPRGQRSFDPDDWTIWNDDGYGDLNGDGFPELPVSRIPDGQRGDVVLAALCAGARTQTPGKSGVRNRERKYADQIFSFLPGSEVLQVSAPADPRSLPRGIADSAMQYLVLHGSYLDQRVFHGEDDNGAFEGFSGENIAAGASDAVVFCACCWGALTTSRPAISWRPGMPIPSLTPSESIPLSYLRNGARAFVGATGVHFPPDPSDTINNNGGPLHSLFWEFFLQGRPTEGFGPQPPAEALRRAKVAYKNGRPYFSAGSRAEPHTPLDDAIEIKHTFQFTCLGLGW